jgi:folylpolyglutamate synthase/dihydropteroate synthase
MLGWLSDLGAIAESFASIADAVDAARDRRDKDEFIVICGSFAAVKETMQHFGYASVEDSYLSNAEA